MPELPEVEITRLGLLALIDQQVSKVNVYQPRLRWPIPADLATKLQGKTLTALTRRAKYILATLSDDIQTGTLLLHLGMSGRLCLLERYFPPEKHDHLDIQFIDGRVMRLRDPRRFGAALWLNGDATQHALLKNLGPEPLTEAFNDNYLYQHLRTRKLAIKSAIMDAHLVVGVGNIYASESLFRARIHPELPAYCLSRKRCQLLTQEIKNTLNSALQAGGSSLRDFFGVDGNPGYFQQSYFVYGRTGQPCRMCASTIMTIRQGQRSTFYCPNCQH